MESPIHEETAGVPAHPYYPVSAPLSHYTVNQTPVAVLLVSFGVIILASVAAAVQLARRACPSLSVADQLTVAWFALCGFLHCFFEGYYIYHHEDLAGLQTLFGQLWKEYSLSDSRYLTSDPFMLCVESLTVLMWGPLCWTIVWAIAKRSNFRYPLTAIMCVGHLYGVMLYYSTSLTEYYLHGVSHSRPEFLYFWVYYVGFNGPWVVVPAILLYRNVMYIKRKLDGSEHAQFVVNSVDGPLGKKDL